MSVKYVTVPRRLSAVNAIPIGFLFLLPFSVISQTIKQASSSALPPPSEVLRSYSTEQKRLLLISAVNFTNLVVGNLDGDSATNIGCWITGQPFLLAYDEGFENQLSGAEGLINAGRLMEAASLVPQSTGYRKIQLLIELAIRYLHRADRAKRDLDSAEHYLAAADAFLKSGTNYMWRKESLLVGAELWFQKGNDSAGMAVLSQAKTASEQMHDSNTLARVWEFQGKRRAANDPAKLWYFQKALDYYHRKQQKEKEIGVLWDIVAYHCPRNPKEMADNLTRILSLQVSDHFFHTLYAQNIYAFALANQIKFIEALDAAYAALVNMQWSDLKAVAGTVYDRIGATYVCLGKFEEATIWYRKALDVGTNETHMFWYKALFYLSGDLDEMNQPGEAIAVMDSVMNKFPPLTTWEKMEEMATKGLCCDELNNTPAANRCYIKLFELAKSDPSADLHGELNTDFLQAAHFYVRHLNISMARRFIKLANVVDRSDPYTSSIKYSLLFSIDSVEGKYRVALKDRILYKANHEAFVAIDQRKQIDALEVKYAAEKKDEEIRLLKKQRAVQQADIARSKIIGDFLIGGAALLVLIIGLVLSQYRLKRRAVAEMNRKNARLRKLAQEKEWLLNEVNSRVKQNLHTVTCLLESQAIYLQNDARKAIEISQHRIYAMSLLHQKLFQNDNRGYVDMSVYLPEFIRYLDESFDAHYRIDFQLAIHPVRISIAQAIPVALIINEAVTNSIKYAFPENARGVVSISMQEQDGNIRLSIADNGVGFQEVAGSARAQSLGLKLIEGLSEDLNATVEWNTVNGTQISIDFRPEPVPGAPIMDGELIEVVI